MTTRADFRSDTVTQPTPAMREAMARAVVGDDGFGEDPTIAELESTYAAMVGKDAALFVPSGVMANQIAMRVLTRPGDVVVAGHRSHVVSFEMGAAARNAGVQFATVDDHHGGLDHAAVLEHIDGVADHWPSIGAVFVENTNMFHGGVPYDLASLRRLAAAVPVPMHMDGARLFNAVVATGVPAADFAAPVTTVMTCLSKGLAAPVGSLLAGPAPLMDVARVERKRLGGSMRQAGVLAAAGLVALREGIDRLADDHARARRLADYVATAFPELDFDPLEVQTNIVVVDHPRAREVAAALEEHGVFAGTVGPSRLRFVTHRDNTDEDIERAGAALATVSRS
jgi:threonine aldolase